jgi:hypothetical protein
MRTLTISRFKTPNKHPILILRKQEELLDK